MRPPITDDELERRIADLQAAGMILAARALMRELSRRARHG